MNIYHVGCYAITVERGTITGFELVEKSGGLVPKIGQEFNAYLHKAKISRNDIKDITPRIKPQVSNIHPVMQQFVDAIYLGGCR